MTTPKITGNEPYYPFVESAEPGLSVNTGITIKQKFIADYICHANGNPALSQVSQNDIAAEAAIAFQSYLKIINGE